VKNKPKLNVLLNENANFEFCSLQIAQKNRYSVSCEKCSPCNFSSEVNISVVQLIRQTNENNNSTQYLNQICQNTHKINKSCRTIEIILK